MCIRDSANGRSDSRAPFERAGWAPGAIGTLPVQVRRNAYGRQLASFHAEAALRSNKEGEDEAPNIPLTFIRAPQIVATGEGVETLVSVDEAPVAVRFGNQIGITFHPCLLYTSHRAHFYALLLFSVVLFFALSWL